MEAFNNASDIVAEDAEEHADDEVDDEEEVDEDVLDANANGCE